MGVIRSLCGSHRESDMTLNIEQMKEKAAELAVEEVFRLNYDFPGGAQVAEFNEMYCVYVGHERVLS